MFLVNQTKPKVIKQPYLEKVKEVGWKREDLWSLLTPNPLIWDWRVDEPNEAVAILSLPLSLFLSHSFWRSFNG